jgi:nucleoid-associated protein YgaU
MIERVSRYYDGPLAQPKQKYTSLPTIAVYRKFAESTATSYATYTWKEGDSYAALADRFFGNSKYWWKILEINPTLTDPFSITPGTRITMPYVG